MKHGRIKEELGITLIGMVVLMLLVILIIGLAIGVFIAVGEDKSTTISGDITGDTTSGNITVDTSEIMKQINSIEEKEIEDKSKEIIQFALDIFRELEKGENVLISPLSIIYALGATTNGASGETLTQMENVLNTDIESLNKYLYTYMSNLPQNEKYNVDLANSIWINKSKDITVKDEFVATNLAYYNSEVFLEEFNLNTVKNVNSWVKDKTNDMIDEVISEEDMKDDTLMYLVNALSFDAEWEEIYEETSIRTRDFTNYDKTVSETEMMSSTEYGYLELENATGFKKYYVDEKYAFVALLPNEDIDINDFVDSLDGIELVEILEKESREEVLTRIPKFSFEYGNTLKDILESIGMQNAFDEQVADFSNMAILDESINKRIWISEVIHKTKIELDEKGTKAGAATVVVMSGEDSMAPLEEYIEPKKVYLDRPFFYMIVDEENNVPLFMGTYLTVE